MRRGRTTAGILISAMLLLITAGPTMSAQNFVADGVLWEDSYEGDLLPDQETPSWAHNFPNGGSTLTGNSSLVISTPAPNGAEESWFMGDAPGAWNHTADSTLEMRLRILDANPNPNGAGSMQLFGGTPGGTIRIRNFELDISGNGMNLGGTALNDGPFHILRLTIESDLFTLYVDNDPTPVASATINSGLGLQRIHWGDLLGDTSGTIEWDYIRWTNSIAAPAPEPATLALIGLGGLAMTMRRRAGSGS